MKKIKIGNQEYPIECNALTLIKYKNFFKKGILEDIQILQDYTVRYIFISQKAEEEKLDVTDKVTYISDYMLKYIDDYIEAVTRVAWILIYTADKEIKEYEEWLKSITKIKVDDDWIAEVTEFAVDCFC